MVGCLPVYKGQVNWGCCHFASVPQNRIITFFLLCKTSFFLRSHWWFGPQTRQKTSTVALHRPQYGFPHGERFHLWSLGSCLWLASESGYVWISILEWIIMQISLIALGQIMLNALSLILNLYFLFVFVLRIFQESWQPSPLGDNTHARVCLNVQQLKAKYSFFSPKNLTVGGCHYLT